MTEIISQERLKTGLSGTENDLDDFVCAANRRFIAEEKEEQLAKKKKIGLWYIKPVLIEVFAKEYQRTVDFSDAQWEVAKAIFPKLPEDYGDPFFGVNEAFIKVGQGGGKNVLMVFLLNYSMYLWCCMYDPHRFCGKNKQENFDILVYSQVSERQARNVFFNNLGLAMQNTIDPVTGGNWYEENIGMRLQEYGHKDMKEREMTIKHRDRLRGNIRIFCLDTTAGSVEGYTIWIRITDEPSRANTPAKYAVAKHQYKTANGNQETRFDEGYRLGVMFAYPEQETNDLLVEKFELNSKRAKPNSIEIYDGVLTAWYYAHVFNPTLTEKDYLKSRSKPGADIIDIDRRWKAIVPPNKYGFFMPYFDKINECANPNLKNKVEYKPTLTRREVKVKGKDTYREFTAVEILKVLGDNRRRYWGYDTSETGDSFIIVGGYPDVLEHKVSDLKLEHYSKSGELEKEVISFNCKPVIDIIIVYNPSRKHPVDYVNVENIFNRLLGDEFRESKGIQSDKYQSESLRQKMLDLGIRGAEAMFFSNPVQIRMGKIFRHLVWNNAVDYLDYPQLIREMRKLLLINNNKLDHPEGESKDIYDSIVNCICQIIESGIDMRKLDIEGIKPGEKEEKTDVEKESDKRLEMYKDGLKKFQDKYGRMYYDAREFCTFMRSIGKRFEETDVDICEVDIEYRDAQIRASIPHVEDYHKRPGGGLDMGLPEDF